jgi:hypothetical protein
MPQDRENRLQELKHEIQERFGQICREMESEDFTKLVDEMARFRLKYEDLEIELQKRRAEDAGQKA